MDGPEIAKAALEPRLWFAASLVLIVVATGLRSSWKRRQFVLPPSSHVPQLVFAMGTLYASLSIMALVFGWREFGDFNTEGWFLGAASAWLALDSVKRLIGLVRPPRGVPEEEPPEPPSGDEPQE